MAWVLRSRACLALPPAESPSTMNSSVSPPPSPVQSVSLPGRRSLRALVAVLRLTSRSALRRRRSSIRSMTWARRALPRSMFDVRKWSKWSRTAFSTRRAASGLVRRSLVCDWNWGSRMKTLSIASQPCAMSSGVMSLARLLPTRSPKARMPRVSAVRRPCSCVPPSGVGMVLQYQLYAPSVHSGHATAHSTWPCAKPCSAGKSCRPVKLWVVTHSRVPTCSARWSARPPGNWNTASAGQSSLASDGAQCQRISTPANR